MTADAFHLLAQAIYHRLSGGDLRSTAESDAIAQAAAHDPAIPPILLAGLAAPDRLLRMRCADALEKLTRRQTACLAAQGERFLALLDPAQPKELLWHIVQMTPRITWPAAQRPALFDALEHCLTAESSIVRTCVMQALVELLVQAPERTGAVRAHIARLTADGSRAMHARGAKLLQRLG